MAVHLIHGDIFVSPIKKKFFPFGLKFYNDEAQPLDKLYMKRVLKEIRKSLSIGDKLAIPLYKGKTYKEGYQDIVKDVLGLCYEVYLYDDMG